MAVALKCATVGGTASAYPLVDVDADVGHQVGIHVVFSLGLFHLLNESVPVGIRANGDIDSHPCKGKLVGVLIAGYGFAHPHTEVDHVKDARAVELHHLLARRDLLVGEHDGGGIDGLGISVEGREAHRHLCATVPDGIALGAVVPLNPDGALRLVFPLGCVAGVHLQQVQVRELYIG